MIMQRKTWLYCMLMVLVIKPQVMCAHGSFNEHKYDMYRVLGFMENPQITKWMEFISTEMIDKCYDSEFYKSLQSNYPDFKCKHRLLFHWGYNDEPWNTPIELKVRDYASQKSLNQDSLVKVFKEDFKKEQKRRNSEMNKRTENLFGFASGGKDAARANFFAAIVYDVHLLGDYTDDNRDFDGLVSFDRVVRDIADRVTKLDPSDRKGKVVVANLNKIRNCGLNREDKAKQVIDYLSTALPSFIMTVEGGSIYRRLQNKGFYINCISNAAAEAA